MQISKTNQILIVAIAAVALIAISVVVFFMLGTPSTQIDADTTVSPSPTVTVSDEPSPEQPSPSAKPSATVKPSVKPSVAPTPTPVQYAIYVDPVNGKDTNDGKAVTSAVKTLAQAQKLVRANNTRMEKDITVYLRGGTHVLDSTLTFTTADNGKNGHNVIWKAYNNEKPIISGGSTIKSWKLHDSGKNIWVASANGVTSYDFYVNGERATVARGPQITGGTLDDGRKAVTLPAGAGGYLQQFIYTCRRHGPRIAECLGL